MANYTDTRCFKSETTMILLKDNIFAVFCYRIDHWDNEREKLILLCEKSVLIVHFDFITLKLKSTKRILLQNITCLRLGQLMYPKKSLMK